jgi:hypothetical protein
VGRAQFAVGNLSLGGLRRLSGRRKRRFWWVFLGLLGAYFLAVSSSGTCLGFEKLGSRPRAVKGYRGWDGYRIAKAVWPALSAYECWPRR